MSLGFTHMGRFSVEYRKRFGESPSETLDQRRGMSPATGTSHDFIVEEEFHRQRRGTPSATALPSSSGRLRQPISITLS